MKIGIIGAGKVGETLGRRWAQAGHAIYYGVRDVQDPAVAELKQRGGEGMTIGTAQEAAAFGEVVVFAVPYAALETVVREAGDFGDRTLIDCTNPIAQDFSGLSCAGTSAAEEIARWSGSGRVVKAFNTIGFNVMANPVFDSQRASLLYCGDDTEAKQVVARLATELQFDPIDAGPLHQAHWLEAFAWLWISMAMKHGHGREMAFVLHKRGAETGA